MRKCKGPELAIQIPRTNKDMGKMLLSQVIKELKIKRMECHVLTNWQVLKTLATPRETGIS